MNKPVTALILSHLLVSLAVGPVALAQPNIEPLPPTPSPSAPAAAPAAPTAPAAGPARRQRGVGAQRRGARRTTSPVTGAAAGAAAGVAAGAAVGAAATGGTSAGGASSGIVTAGGPTELPGEKEFNQCKKLPPGRRVVKFNFKPDSDLADLIGTIAGITCAQFLYTSSDVSQKKITIISPQLVTPEEAYRLFLAVLESHGLTVEPMGRYLRIVATSRARYANLPFYKDGERPPASDKRYVTRLVRLEYLDAQDAATNLLSRIKGEQGDIISYQGSLIVTDQAVMIDRMVEILKELDVPSVVKEKIWMLRIKNMSASEMASRLAEIFQVQQIGTGGRRQGGPGAPPPPAPASGARPAGNAKTPADLASQMVITKLIPDERSNHLIVIASDRSYEWLLTIVKKLDAPIEGGGDGRFHIYYCEHASCDELAATLAAVAGVSVVGGTGQRRATRTSAPGMAPVPPPMPTSPNQQGQQQNLFEGEVRVTFDASTNALVVFSSLKDFQSLRKVIERLDAPRKQVYVEAMILEVLVDKSRQLGVSYHGGYPFTAGGERSVALGGFNANKTLSPAALASDLVGLSGAVFGPALDAAVTRIFGVTADIPSFGVFVKMLQNNNDVNVLSSPHLLLMNNQEGEITVGQNLPFPGSVGGLGGLGALGGLAGAAGAGGALGALGGLGFGTSVNRQDVSLRLKLVPSVNEHNTIRLDVDVEIQDVASQNYNNLGPATSKRTAKTLVACRDQQTVVIGGLMNDRVSETVEKIPILGDIPVLGFFFRNTRKEMQKSNIIIALTPYVIGDMSDLRLVAEKKMRERREFMERYSGVEDNVKLEANIDYRRKRGMVEEINRTAREIDEEEQQLRLIRERDLREESTPIELPPGRMRAAEEPTGPRRAALRTSTSEAGAVDPGVAPAGTPQNVPTPSGATGEAPSAPVGGAVPAPAPGGAAPAPVGAPGPAPGGGTPPPGPPAAPAPSGAPAPQ
jgi:general secretion pathway protein D